MHTDPSLGFFIVPRDIISDLDFQTLSDSELRVWFHLLALCHPQQIRIGRLQLPAYSWAAREDEMIEVIGVKVPDLRKALKRLEGFDWIAVRNDGTLTMITLKRAHKWQKFQTYRKGRRHG